MITHHCAEDYEYNEEQEKENQFQGDESGQDYESHDYGVSESLIFLAKFVL